MMGPYGWPGGGMGWGGWLAMSIGLLIMCIVVVIGAVLVVRSFAHHRDLTTESPGVSAALRILDERFARAEVDADEYKRRCQVLDTP